LNKPIERKKSRPFRQGAVRKRSPLLPFRASGSRVEKEKTVLQGGVEVQNKRARPKGESERGEHE